RCSPNRAGLLGVVQERYVCRTALWPPESERQPLPARLSASEAWVDLAPALWRLPAEQPTVHRLMRPSASQIDGEWVYSCSKQQPPMTWVGMKTAVHGIGF